MNVDPGETQNLAGEPTHWDRMHELGQRIQRWQMDTKDTVQLPDLPGHK